MHSVHRRESSRVIRYAPAEIQVHIPQQLKVVGFTTLDLHLTDPEGLPIEHAQFVSDARMTNLDMVTHEKRMQR